MESSPKEIEEKDYLQQGGKGPRKVAEVWGLNHRRQGIITKAVSK